jgi:glycosyltransferase involved in cell wall biosynthesis
MTQREPGASAPGVLLVTGAYYPEISASAVQCQAVVRALGDRVRFFVLTTAVDRRLPLAGLVEDVPVDRVPIDVGSRGSKLAASLRFASRILALGSKLDVVHLHGVSQKNILVTAVAKLLAKRIVVTLHTAGQDEPSVIARRGFASRWAFGAADAVVTVSPQLSAAYLEAGREPGKLREIQNGLDTDRFRKATPEERVAHRRALGLPADAAVRLFVGFFSRDKRPDLAFEAFRRLAVRRANLALVFVGATRAGYHEIDASLAQRMAATARADGFADRVRFVDPVHAIERYYQASDIFVMPSARESFSLVLLEAMSCGLPCVASRLPGATDMLIDDRVNGRLVTVDDRNELTAALETMLNDPAAACRLGERARQTVVSRFDIRQTAERWLETYRDVLSPSRS